jgi:hypothetical protein
MKDLHQAMAAIQILRPPKNHLATFGTTTLNYVLLSIPEEEPLACRVRQGSVTAERPQILTPDLWKERFDGFGEDASDYAEHMNRLYGARLRALEYRFRNDLQSTTLEHAPLAELVERVQTQLDRENAPRTGLVRGPDVHWSLGVMKFVIDATLQSFPSNVQELNERGLFDPEQRRETQTRQQIEKLFAQAARDKTQIKILGETLRSAGLFKEYEDRFFALLKA